MERYYFHLVNGHEIVPDRVGVEAADLAAARNEAMAAIHEFRRDSPAATGWDGWRIEVTDASGTTVMTIDLGDDCIRESQRERLLPM